MISIEFPDNASSPIKYLWNPIFDAVVYRNNLRSNGPKSITISLKEYNEWRSEALSSWGLIALDSLVFEVIWAFAYSNFLFYKKYIEGRRPGTFVPFQLNQGDQIESKLLEWAIKKISGHSTTHSFDELFQQVSPTIEKEVADHISRDAASFFIHHEIGHTHEPDGESLQIEEYCDTESALTILGVNIESCETMNPKAKSGIGVATGLLAILAKGIETNDYDGLKHPKDYDRLINTLEQHFDSDCDIVWGYVVGIISVHLSRVGIDALKEPFDNFYLCAKAMNSQLKEIDRQGIG